MNRDFYTMYQDALAKAFIVLTPQGKRLAVFPYGAGADDVPEKQARKHAWLFLNRTNGQEHAQEESAKFARYVVVPTSGGKWAVMDTARTHNVNVAVFNTEGEALVGAAQLNEQEKGDCQ